MNWNSDKVQLVADSVVRIERNCARSEDFKWAPTATEIARHPEWCREFQARLVVTRELGPFHDHADPAWQQMFSDRLARERPVVAKAALNELAAAAASHEADRDNTSYHDLLKKGAAEAAAQLADMCLDRDRRIQVLERTVEEVRLVAEELEELLIGAPRPTEVDSDVYTDWYDRQTDARSLILADRHRATPDVSRER